MEKEHPTFKYNFKESREATNKRYKKWADSTYQQLSEKLIYYVNDTLYNPKEMGLKVRYYPKIKDDPSLLKLEKKLFTEEYPKQAIRLKGLTIGNYLFKSADSIEHLNRNSLQKVILSRVVFNSNHTKACYYISQRFPENHWANGEIIHVEKKQGKWFLLYRKPYWIT
ncbi:hypothetical protein GO621_08515 [Mucilaginibacter sp. HMF7410]|uniref:Uncharacterized protein n=2 Tax=Mucilaginibacter arboris TaxID=2682090 RepID=A0A7K1SW63_9SPHI|nr:hypothetical protein [Mucilaginibacter arboris]